MMKYENMPDSSRRYLVLLPSFICLLALNSCSQASAGAPTEKEMCGAIEAKIAGINENMQHTRRLCEQHAYRNDPALAMQCLAQYGASGGTGKMSVRMTRCEKVACQKSTNQAGYMCDYNAGLDMPGNVAMRGSLGAQLADGAMAQARFVRTAHGWLFIPVEK